MHNEENEVTEVTESKKKNSVDRKEIIEFIKNTVIMVLIALVAGGILGFVYEVTKDPIAKMAFEEKQKANKKVFLSADHFEDLPLIDETSYTAFKAAYPNADITAVIKALGNDGSELGYVLEATSHKGYGGDIVFAVGITNEGMLNGISIIDISETAGLGMRADEVLTPQFANKEALHFEVVKTGAIEANQIDAISSATITSKAVTDGVNAAIEYFEMFLTGGVGNES